VRRDLLRFLADVVAGALYRPDPSAGPCRDAYLSRVLNTRCPRADQELIPADDGYFLCRCEEDDR